MEHKAELFKQRTKAFALRIIRLVRSVPNTQEGRVIGHQLLRSGTSIAANYRAACRARSRAEFLSKISTVVEEADETVFWLELLADAGVVASSRLRDLKSEAEELVAIFNASRVTARRNAQSAIKNQKSTIKNRETIKGIYCG
jgi:four helix bundle protein